LGSCGIGVAGRGGGEGGGGGGRTMTCAKGGLAVSTIDMTSAMRAITSGSPFYELPLGGGVGNTMPTARGIIWRIALFGLVARDPKEADQTLEHPRCPSRQGALPRRHGVRYRFQALHGCGRHLALHPRSHFNAERSRHAVPDCASAPPVGCSMRFGFLQRLRAGGPGTG